MPMEKSNNKSPHANFRKEKKSKQRNRDESQSYIVIFQDVNTGVSETYIILRIIKEHMMAYFIKRTYWKRM